MVRTRQAKIDGIARAIPPLEVDDPSGTAKVLVLGWGSTYGPIGAGVRRVRKVGGQIAQAHLRHLNPFPPNLGEVLKRYERVLVPEMNLGQLAMLLRAKYLVDVVSYAQVRGLPLGAAELARVIGNLVEETDGVVTGGKLGADAASLPHGGMVNGNGNGSAPSREEAAR
jgi:2-oxoglutarate ferredoxin oxidoreductase subunit alpha